MIETLYMKSGTVQLRLVCANCGKREFLDEPTKTFAIYRAKQHGWRLLRGDAFCGEPCNMAAKEKK